MKNNYRFSSVLIALLAVTYSLLAQSTVFVDNFNRAILSPGGTPSMTYSSWSSTSPSGVVAVTSTAPSNLSIYTNAAAGRTYVYGSTSTFVSGFNQVLKNNTDSVSWIFSMRTGRTTALSGFTGAATYGVAIILACDGSDFHTANGYAVTIRKGTTTNKAQLVKFAGGLDDDANITVIGTASAEFASNNNYGSFRVNYEPSTDAWSFYFRNDASTYTDPTTGTLTRVGTNTVDNTYTSSSCTNFGYYYNHGGTSTPTSNKAIFYYLKVMTNIAVTYTSGWPKADNPTAGGFTAKTKTNVGGKTYFVVLAQGATAPSSAQVKAGQDASGNSLASNLYGSITATSAETDYTTAVTGLSSGTSYDVYFVAEDESGKNLQASPVKVQVTTTTSAFAPTIESPTATSISNIAATLGGNITSDGGSAITERGTVWKTTTGVTIDDNKLAEGATSTGVFSHARIDLPAKTQIFYKAYATNSIGNTLTSEASFYTKATEPAVTSSISATATPSESTKIDLTWGAIDGADGYLILQRDGALQPGTNAADGTIYAIGNVIGSGTVVAIINSGATTSTQISGLIPGNTYTYRIAAFGYDGSNAATMNYASIAGTLSATATTNLSTGLGQISNKFKAYSSNGRLFLTGGELFNSIGVKIVSVKPDTMIITISLNPGIYFVKTVTGTQKVVVR
jgi:hypothetical protein